MWMHNGNIANWTHLKRRLAMDIDSRWFIGVQGNTDSEWAFALFLDSLHKAGYDPSDESYARAGFGHTILRTAMLQTVARINGYALEAASEAATTQACDARSLLNFAVTDGHSVVCTRYVSSKTDEAASLYFSSGTNWKCTNVKGQFRMERHDKGADIVLVASEPLTFERGKYGLFEYFYSYSL